ncbi:hypothetical protein KHDHEBDM_00144 [Pectobacterium polaris]|nr:hypothetical protein KHDHEBDM_00144 [Pectobacterium polaris]
MARTDGAMRQQICDAYLFRKEVILAQALGREKEVLLENNSNQSRSEQSSLVVIN